jgi:hypothetical protein
MSPMTLDYRSKHLISLGYSQQLLHVRSRWYYRRTTAESAMVARVLIERSRWCYRGTTAESAVVARVLIERDSEITEDAWSGRE